MAIWKKRIPDTDISVGGRDVPVGTPHFDPEKLVEEGTAAIRKDLSGTTFSNEPENPSILGPTFSWHKLPQQKQTNTNKASPRILRGAYVVKDSDTTVAKFNENHVPAGSPEGGQFASGSSAGGGPDDETKFKDLKQRWAKINEDLRPMMGEKEHTPEAKQKLTELKNIVKDIYTLDAQKEGDKDVGSPGPNHDVIIIGGGPAGLSAAINAGAEGLNSVLVDANERLGGQAKYSSRIENFAGFPIGITGRDLTNNMIEQAARMGSEIKSGVRAVGLSYDEKTGIKTVELSDGTKEIAKAVVLAGGLEFRKLDFPGADSKGVVVGDGEQLAKVTVGKPAVVIGGSNGAAQAVLGVAQTASHVTLLARTPIKDSMSDYQVQALKAQTTGANPKVTIIEGDEAKELAPTKDGYQLTTKKGAHIDTAAVGVFVGSGPSTKWLPSSINIAHEGADNGKIVVDSDFQTSLPGVYAVGDTIVNGPQRVLASAGEGQIAVRNVFKYFKTLKDVKKADKTKDGIKEWNDLVDAMYLIDTSDADKFQPDATNVKKYDDDEARDSHGKWTLGANSDGTGLPHSSLDGNVFHSVDEAAKVLPKVTFYHGTSSNLVDSIKKEGLIPGHSGGADAWAEKNIGSVATAIFGSRPSSVFFSDKATHATDYAKLVRDEYPGSKAVLLKIKIPATEWNKLKLDEFDTNAYRFEEPVKPEWIIGQKIVTGEAHIPTVEKSDGILYAVVPFMESDSLEKFDDTESRDDHGRWTSVAQMFKDSLGVKRGDMPQIPNGDLKDKFVRKLEKKGIKVTAETVPARSLKPSQKDYNKENIAHVRAAYDAGKNNDKNPIIISKDNRILDGHHRWVVLAQDNKPVKVLRVDLPIHTLLMKAAAFNAKEGIKARDANTVDHKIKKSDPDLFYMLESLDTVLIIKDSADSEPTNPPDNNGRPQWMSSPGHGGKDPVYRSQKPDGNKDELFSENINENPKPLIPVDENEYYIW